MEHVVFNYVKIVYVCGDSENEAIGDIPGGPFCFSKSNCLSIKDVPSCWSDWHDYKGLRIRFGAAKVGGQLRTVSFHVKGLSCGEEPEALYRVVKELLTELCGEEVRP